MTKRFLGLSTAAGIVIVVTAVVVSHGRPNVRVSFSDVTDGSINRLTMTTGTLEPARAVDVGTQVSGTVQTLAADFNARVHAGEVIARLDPSIYNSQVAQASAALVQAQAKAAQLTVTLDDANAKLHRAEQLAADDLIAKADLEAAQVAARQAKADLRAQEAAVQAARAMVKQAEVNRDHTVIRSPIDGVIVNRAVEIGQTLAASVQSPVLFTIADLSRMHLFADINEAEVGEITRGTDVTFQVDAIGARPLKATVAELRLEPNVQAAASSNSSSSSNTASSSGQASSGGNSGGANAARSGSAPASASQPGNAVATTGTTTTGLTTSNGPGVVSYTAVIDVDNRDGRLTPGSTATITIPVGSRTNVVRIPNNALSFRPSVDVLQAAGQKPPTLKQIESAAQQVANRPAYVWKYENGQFVPVLIQVGLADEQWTELLSGDVRPGDRLVVAAGIAK
jgi:RND family efflux transporter MFP subunit